MLKFVETRVNYTDITGNMLDLHWVFNYVLQSHANRQEVCI